MLPSGTAQVNLPPEGRPICHYFVTRRLQIKQIGIGKRKADQEVGTFLVHAPRLSLKIADIGCQAELLINFHVHPPGNAQFVFQVRRHIFAVAYIVAEIAFELKFHLIGNGAFRPDPYFIGAFSHLVAAVGKVIFADRRRVQFLDCLLYTSDAADE